MNRNKEFPYIAFIILLFVFCIISYILSGVCRVEGVTSENILLYLLYFILHPMEAYNEYTVAFVSIGFILWFAIVNYYMQYHRNYHSDAFGSDGWRDVDEANKCYADKDDKNNRIVSQNLKVSLEKGLSNNNMVVIASSGSFKTTGLVEQNLLQFGSTYIVLDVKGELKRKWGQTFIDHGYSLKTLDFKTPSKSDQYNPFVGIETEADVLRIGATILDACRPKKEISAQDPFWDDAVLLYSQALYFAAWLEARETGMVGTMNRVMELAQMESIKVGVDANTKRTITQLQIYMDELADRHGDDYPPVRDYRKLKEGAPDTVGSVILMLNGMLNICNTAEVRRIFEGNDINLRELGAGVGGDVNKKSVVFLCIPDENPVYNWIVSVFYTQCISILSRLSDDEIGGPLPIRVEFWMDEFYAGCRPADVEKLLGIIRGRNISMVLILQSIAQLETLYPGSKWKIMMDNLAIMLFMGSGPGATETHEYISKMLGTETIDIMNDSANFSQQSSSGINFSQQKRELMTPTEVKRLSTKEAIVFIESSQPIRDYKAIPFDTKDGEYFAPKWLKERYFANLGKYEHPVETFYDAEKFKYITIKKEVPFKVFKDEDEIRMLLQEADKDETMYVCKIDEKDLLYLSWGKGEYSTEKIEALYQEALKEEEVQNMELNNLLIMQDVKRLGNVPNFGTGEVKDNTIDKSTWKECKTLKELWEKHWEDLSEEEQLELCAGVDDGLYEHQMYQLMITDATKMSSLRRAFILENQARG